MRRYVVVANQTLGSAELREELRKRLEADPDSYFYVLVPNTRASDYHGVPAAGGFVPMPTLISASGPATNEEATAEAQRRLDQLLQGRLRQPAERSNVVGEDLQPDDAHVSFLSDAGASHGLGAL